MYKNHLGEFEFWRNNVLFLARKFKWFREYHGFSNFARKLAEISFNLALRIKKNDLISFQSRCEPSSSVLRNLILPVGFLANKCLFPVLFVHFTTQGALWNSTVWRSFLLLSGGGALQRFLDSTTFRRVEWSNGRVILFFSSLEWRETYGHVHMSFNLILFSGLSNTCVTTSKMKSKNHKNLVFSGLLLSTITGKLISLLSH